MMSVMQIEQIDKNLNPRLIISEPDAKFYDVRTAPVDIYGLYRPREGEIFRRMPQEAAEAVSPSVAALATNTSGGRLRFKTDSEYIAIRMTRPGERSVMSHMPYLAACGFDGYWKEDGEYHYFGSFVPSLKRPMGYETTIHFETRKLRDITINFPLYGQVKDLFLAIQEDAVLTPGDRYTNEKPVVYYGSSTTQGGCASRPGNSYQGFLSRWLDIDFVNLGFSGSAKGEKAMAEYLAGLDMSVFFMDYDGNSDYPNLQSTHWRMYEIFRAAQPDTPIIMGTRTYTNFRDSAVAESHLRMQALTENYQRALALGDQRIFFVDGRTFFDQFGGDNCTVDGVHPNDLGFFGTAQTIRPYLEKALALACK